MILPRARSPSFNLFSIIIALFLAFMIGLALPAPGQAVGNNTQLIADLNDVLIHPGTAIFPSLNNLITPAAQETVINYWAAIQDKIFISAARPCDQALSPNPLIWTAIDQDMQISALMIFNKGDPTDLPKHIIVDATNYLYGTQAQAATSETKGYVYKFIL